MSNSRVLNIESISVKYSALYCCDLAISPLMFIEFGKITQRYREPVQYSTFLCEIAAYIHILEGGVWFSCCQRVLYSHS